MRAVANREISCIRASTSSDTSDDGSWLPGRAHACPERHIGLLQQFLTVLPYILPSRDASCPALLHNDLHSDNIFVDKNDPSKLTGIIDWQAAYIAPLFLQARIPAVFDYDYAYPWGGDQPKLPEDFHKLPLPMRKEAIQQLERQRLKKQYELTTRNLNPRLARAMDEIEVRDDPTSSIFHVVGNISINGPIALQELLIQIYEKWDLIAARRRIRVPCPLTFTEEEIRQARQTAKEWTDAYNEFETLRSELLGKDGWVSHENFEEARRRFEAQRGQLEDRWKRLVDVTRAL